MGKRNTTQAEQDVRRPCVMLAFGPGLAVEAALLE